MSFISCDEGGRARLTPEREIVMRQFSQRAYREGKILKANVIHQGGTRSSTPAPLKNRQGRGGKIPLCKKKKKKRGGEKNLSYQVRACWLKKMRPPSNLPRTDLERPFVQGGGESWCCGRGNGGGRKGAFFLSARQKKAPQWILAAGADG